MGAEAKASSQLFKFLQRLSGHAIFAARFRDHFQVSEVPVMSKRKTLVLSDVVDSSIPADRRVHYHACPECWSAGSQGDELVDPATWPNRKVPVAGDKVVIEQNQQVVLDVTPPALNGVTINGKLSFANNKDVELTTEWIMVHGELEIGTEKAPSHPQGDNYLHEQRQRRRYQWSGWNDRQG
jgi:hypothetical protein